MSTAAAHRRPLGLAVFLLIAGAIGLAAAFTLTLDKFALLADPDAQLSCNFSVLVGCTANLNSWQGELFGFPNPLLGLIGWTATMAVGGAILAGARLARWFWWLFALGVAGALALVVFLIGQSIYVLAVLCPWCMVTWAVTIPTFLLVALHVLRAGIVTSNPRVRRVAGTLYGWVPLMTFACYATVFVLAQLQLDVLNRL